MYTFGIENINANCMFFGYNFYFVFVFIFMYCISHLVPVTTHVMQMDTHTLHFNGHFQVNLGQPVAPLILLLHLFLAFVTQSNQVFFGRPLCLIPSTSHVIQRLTQSLSSFRSTCPNHLNLLFQIIKLTDADNVTEKQSCIFLMTWQLPDVVYTLAVVTLFLPVQQSLPDCLCNPAVWHDHFHRD